MIQHFGWKKITLAFIVAALCVIFGYDLVALIGGGYDATISATMYTFGQRFPITVFALGVVFGHLFWPNLAAGRARIAKLRAGLGYVLNCYTIEGAKAHAQRALDGDDQA